MLDYLLSPLPANRQRLSCDGYIDDERRDYQNCSVLYSVLQLCTIISALIRLVLTSDRGLSIQLLRFNRVKFVLFLFFLLRVCLYVFFVVVSLVVGMSAISCLQSSDVTKLVDIRIRRM